MKREAGEGGIHKQVALGPGEYGGEQRERKIRWRATESKDRRLV